MHEVEEKKEGVVVRAENVRTKGRKLLDHLSDDKARVAVSFLEFLDEKECWEATKELLKDKGMMASIQRGKADIAAGRVKPWKEVRKNV
jgi:hypothetical protein